MTSMKNVSMCEVVVGGAFFLRPMWPATSGTFQALCCAAPLPRRKVRAMLLQEGENLLTTANVTQCSRKMPLTQLPH